MQDRKIDSRETKYPILSWVTSRHIFIYNSVERQLISSRSSVDGPWRGENMCLAQKVEPSRGDFHSLGMFYPVNTHLSAAELVPLQAKIPLMVFTELFSPLFVTRFFLFSGFALNFYFRSTEQGKRAFRTFSFRLKASRTLESLQRLEIHSFSRHTETTISGDNYDCVARDIFFFLLPASRWLQLPIHLFHVQVSGQEEDFFPFPL
jgi:hypothetical protein